MVKRFSTCGAGCPRVERRKQMLWRLSLVTGTTGRLPDLVQNAPKREWRMAEEYSAHALRLENGM